MARTKLGYTFTIQSQEQRAMSGRRVNFIGYSSGYGAPQRGSEKGPRVYQAMQNVSAFRQQGIEVYWHSDLHCKTLRPGENVNQIQYHLSALLAHDVQCCTRLGESFSVIGGDHTCAIGTWSGAYLGLKQRLQAAHQRGNIRMGLLWLDAHLDSHTPETSESGNTHGMPVAHLLGYGFQPFCELLTHEPKLWPQDVAIIGARSYEEGERRFLEDLNVRVYYADEVHQRGFKAVFCEALAKIKQHTDAYGVSLDLDMFDQQCVPGVGLPQANGILVEEALPAFAQCRQDEKLLGLEIAEFDPSHDIDNKTVRVIDKCCQAFFVKP